VRRVLIEYHELRQHLKATDKKLGIAKHRDRHQERYKKFHSEHPEVNTVTEEVEELEKRRRLLKRKLSYLAAQMFWIGAELKHGISLAGVPNGDDCCQEIVWRYFK